MAEAARTVAVTLSVSPALEERVIDWLLARLDVRTFTSVVVYGYGADDRTLTVAEQVGGRQRRAEFTVEVAAEAVESWLREFTLAFAGAQGRYRVTPVLFSGQLEGVARAPPLPSTEGSDVDPPSSEADLA